MLTPAQLRSNRIHKGLLSLNFVLFCLCFVVSLCPTSQCAISFYAYYSLFFLSQSIQHFLSILMPTIDLLKHEQHIKRYIVMSAAIEISYFFLVFMYWTRADVHPIYCYVSGELGIPIIFGLPLTLHFVISLMVFIQFLHGFISRKYYLLALGGFAVEQRINQQRLENLQQLALLEPYYNEYPVDRNPPTTGKHYQFEDIVEDVEGETVCSICLHKEKEGYHPVYTACKHYFHRECIQDWTKINGSCPDCRAPLREITYLEFAQLSS